MINCNCNCNRRVDCSILALAASIIIGIVAGILRFTAVITLTVPFLWVTFGIALGFLVLLFLKALIGGRTCNNECVCAALPLLLLGILVTLLTSVILLGITFVATSVIGAIVTGVLLAAFSLIFTSTACFVRCTANCPSCD
ncbi:MAG: hypothetical protein E7525_01385 [Ruminococcaceae bacterium]|nr:hypothetical protein [Oscillospiraceae bacterium]